MNEKRRATPDDIANIRERLMQAGVLASVIGSSPEEARSELASDPEYLKSVGHAYILESAFMDGVLGRVHIGYGGHRDEDRKDIGHIVASVLDEAGFEYLWDGQDTHAIALLTDSEAFARIPQFNGLRHTGRLVPDHDTILRMLDDAYAEQTLTEGEFNIAPLLAVTRGDRLSYMREWGWAQEQVMGMAEIADRVKGELSLIIQISNGSSVRFGKQLKIFPWRMM